MKEVGKIKHRWDANISPGIIFQKNKLPPFMFSMFIHWTQLLARGPASGPADKAFIFIFFNPSSEHQASR